MIEEFIEAGMAFTDQHLAKIRDRTGIQLSPSYCDFMKRYGDAFVGGLVDGSLEFPISGFFDAETVLSTFKFNSIYKENQAIPIAECSLGNIWVLSKDGSVHYINFYVRPTVSTRVADDFSNFVSRIVIEDE